MGLRVHLVDGTYELFRHHFGIPEDERARTQFGATRGVLSSMLDLFADGATHMGVATDTVIESFRNDLWPGYKTSEGMPPELLAQFPVLEEALTSMGVAVFGMVELEADDGLASVALLAAEDPAVDEVLIMTPDKDLGQCVGWGGGKVAQFDRRKRERIDAAAVEAKFGVPPPCIPDYLGLVGDSADGFPGLPGWGAKSAAAVLARYGSIDAIPDAAGQWDVPGLRGAARLADTLREKRAEAVLFRRLATLEIDRTLLPGGIGDLRWTGPTDGFAEMAERLGRPELATRAAALARGRRAD